MKVTPITLEWIPDAYEWLRSRRTPRINRKRYATKRTEPRIHAGSKIVPALPQGHWMRAGVYRARAVIDNYMASQITTGKSPLKSIFTRLPGGWPGAFVLLKEVAVRDSESDEAKFVAAFEELAESQVKGKRGVAKSALTVAQVVEAAGLTERRLLEVVVGTAWEKGIRVARLVAALNLEPIMDQAVRQARRPSGYKDRERILQSAGLYPSPTGAVVNVDARQAANAAISDIEQTGAMDEFERDTLESTEFLRGLDTQQQEQKRLDSPSNFVEVRPEPAEPAP